MSEPELAFLAPDETALGARFLRDGYAIVAVEDRAALDDVRDRIADLASAHLGLGPPTEPGPFLDTIHEHVGPSALNELRLAVFRALNADPGLRPRYFSLARRTLETLVGNELCMQRQVNLSIQLPGDDSSILPVHADVLNGDSPFELVQWTPYVDCYRTKSMFVLPAARSAEVQARLAEFRGQGSDALMRHIEPEVVWLEVPYGHTVVFHQILLHGNVVNREAETRWSTNCRYKAVFTPYADKRLGEFFEPITLKPASRMGMDYRLPAGFGEG